MDEQEYPPVIVLFLHFSPAEYDFRLEYALRSIDSVKKNISYPNLKWYLVDGDSGKKNFEKVKSAIGENLVGSHSTKASPGVNWNQGVYECYKHGPIYMRLEDDWVAKEHIEIRPWVRMLMARPDVGMVRMGYLHVPADLKAVGEEGIHYLEMSKSTSFAYGGHPALIHERFHNAYGMFDENAGPGDCEIEFDRQFRAKDGPAIWRPAEIGGWGLWSHIGREQSYA